MSEVDGVGGDEGGRTGLRSCGGDECDGSVDDVGGVGMSAQQPGCARQGALENRAIGRPDRPPGSSLRPADNDEGRSDIAAPAFNKPNEGSSDEAPVEQMSPSAAA